MMSTEKKPQWWCIQPYHKKPIAQPESYDPQKCLVTFPYCIDFCWGPVRFFFGLEEEAVKVQKVSS